MFCRSYNEFFETLANTTNQTIIQCLIKNSMNVSELTQRSRLEQSKVSHALRRMYECKIVDMKKDGKQRIYSLNKETIVPILKIVDGHAKKMCPTCQKIEEKQ